MNNRLTILAHFATNADRTYSTPSLVDLAHVTHTCPTGLIAYPRTHGLDGINKIKKSSRRPPNLAGPDGKVFKEDLKFLRVIRGLNV